MAGVSFSLKGKRKRAIMKEVQEALKLEEDSADTVHITHGMNRTRHELVRFRALRRVYGCKNECHLS